MNELNAKGDVKTAVHVVLSCFHYFFFPPVYSCRPDVVRVRFEDHAERGIDLVEAGTRSDCRKNELVLYSYGYVLLELRGFRRVLFYSSP